MAQCPVCKRHDIFREQTSYLNIIADRFYFDCPQCGAFILTSRTRSLVMDMHPSGVKELLGWISEHNSSGTVPMVSEHFVARIMRGSKEKVLR